MYRNQDASKWQSKLGEGTSWSWRAHQLRLSRGACSKSPGTALSGKCLLRQISGRWWALLFWPFLLCPLTLGARLCSRFCPLLRKSLFAWDFGLGLLECMFLRGWEGRQLLRARRSPHLASAYAKRVGKCWLLLYLLFQLLVWTAPL